MSTFKSGYRNSSDLRPVYAAINQKASTSFVNAQLDTKQDTLSGLSVSSVLQTDGSGNIVATKTVPTGAFVGLSDTQILSNKSFSTATQVTNTTDASSTTTGSIICSGGVGIAKKLYVGTGLVLPNGNTLLDYYLNEAFTPSTAGAWGVAAPTVSCQITRIGNMVTIKFPQTFDTSSAAASIVFTTNLPSYFRPSQTMDMPITVVNGVSAQTGIMRIQTTGQILVYATLATGNFTNAVTIGFLSSCVTYLT